MPVLFALQTALSLWMLTHAIRSGKQAYWFIIVLVPFGEVAYFFAEYLPSRKRRFSPQTFSTKQKRTNLSDIELLAEETPSIENKLLLAQSLYDLGENDRARRLFAELLSRDKDNPEICFGYALSLYDSAQHAEAIDVMQTFVGSNPSFRDYEALLTLEQWLWTLNKKQAAIELLSQYRKRMHPPHVTLRLAQRLESRGEQSEALRLANGIVSWLQTSPKHVRKQNRAIERHARKMATARTA